MKRIICLALAMTLTLFGAALADDPENDSNNKRPHAMQGPPQNHNQLPPKRIFPGKNKPVPQGHFNADNVHNRFRDIENMRKNDPDRFKLLQADAEMDRKIKELVFQFKKEKDEAKKETLRKEISELCVKHFEVRQQRREMDLARMKAWLNQMEQGIEKSRQNKDKIIEQRIKFLLDDNLGEF